MQVVQRNYQVLARSKGKGELRKFLLDVVDLSLISKWAWQGTLSNSYENAVRFYYTQENKLLATAVFVSPLYTPIYDLVTSYDNGKTFVHESTIAWRSGQSERINTLLMLEDGRMIMQAGGYFLYVSNDQGITWTFYKDIYDVFGYDYRPYDCIYLGNGEVLCSAYKGTIRTVDYGQTWNYYGPVDSNHNNSNVTQKTLLENGTMIGLDGSGNYAYNPAMYYIYKSYDRGRTWERTHFPYPPKHGSFPTHKMFNLGNGVVIVCGQFGAADSEPLAISEDYGENFRVLPSLFKYVEKTNKTEPLTTLEGIVLAPGTLMLLCSYYVDGPWGELWAGRQYTAFKTDNYGKSWFEMQGLQIGNLKDSARWPSMIGSRGSNIIQLFNDPTTALVAFTNDQALETQTMLFSDIMD
jgi:hypothetical protein